MTKPVRDRGDMEAVFMFGEFTGQQSCPLWLKDKLKDAGLSELDCHSRFAPSK